jgi:hypothetical protein
MLSSPFSLPRLRLGSGVVTPNRWGGVGIYPYPSFATAIANRLIPTIGLIGPPHLILFINSRTSLRRN